MYACKRCLFGCYRQLEQTETVSLSFKIPLRHPSLCEIMCNLNWKMPSLAKICIFVYTVDDSNVKNACTVMPSHSRYLHESNIHYDLWCSACMLLSYSHELHIHL